jgi:F0F1-type ATP synthase assembly protein I
VGACDFGPVHNVRTGGDPVDKRDRDLQERRELFSAARMIGVLGFTIAFGIIACFLAGVYISRRFELGPAPMILGVLVGVGASFYWVYRSLLKYMERSEPPPEREETTEDSGPEA